LTTAHHRPDTTTTKRLRQRADRKRPVAPKPALTGASGNRLEFDNLIADINKGRRKLRGRI
jgi:hypothetical protein